MKTQTVTISKFKATCLGLLKQVKKNREPILVTLKGEPVAIGGAAAGRRKIS